MPRTAGRATERLRRQQEGRQWKDERRSAKAKWLVSLRQWTSINSPGSGCMNPENCFRKRPDTFTQKWSQNLCWYTDEVRTLPPFCADFWCMGSTPVFASMLFILCKENTLFFNTRQKGNTVTIHVCILWTEVCNWSILVVGCFQLKRKEISLQKSQGEGSILKKYRYVKIWLSQNSHLRNLQ